MRILALCALVCLGLFGCSTSSIETRKRERPATYEGLSTSHKHLVDEGKIQVGMAPEAVYLAWGPAAQVVESETAQGHTTIWIYHGQAVEEYRYWIGRRLESDYHPRTYVRAEVFFENGRVSSWRTLPKPE